MKKQKIVIIAIGIVAMIALLIGVIIEENIRKNTPTKKHATEEEITEIFHLDEEGLPVVLNGKITESRAYDMDAHMYLEYQFVKDNINSKFYWDDNENVLIYTTPTELIKAQVGEKDYTVTKSKKSCDAPIVKTDGENVYVYIDFVKEYSDLTFEKMEEPERMVLVSGTEGKHKVVTATADLKVRVGDGIKKNIIADVEKGTELVVLEAVENQKEDWTRVSVNGGLIGFTQTSNLSKAKNQKISTGYKAPEYASIQKDFTICMGWHQVTNMTANSSLVELVSITKGMNVVSPTWFRICDDEGDITSLADRSYVQQAHLLGLEVWAMVDDQSPDSQDAIVFSHTSSREKLENRLLAEAIEYDLDGINIDFEYIAAENGEDFIQFLREMSIKCRNNGIVLSVDNGVPMAFNKYYNRKEQGEIVDYVVIMGYDEYNVNGSVEDGAKAGSTASLTWVREGIENTLKEVPAEKVINAIPFYCRIWEESNGSVSNQAYGIENSWERMESHNAETAWIADFAQTYAEYSEGGKIYRCWLEDTRSVEAKMKLIQEEKLAGVAAWRLGLETEEIWNIMVKYTN